jgi:hypothetical protein
MWATQDLGAPRFGSQTKLSRSPTEFIANVNKVHHRYDQTLPLFEDVEQPKQLP